MIANRHPDLAALYAEGKCRQALSDYFFHQKPLWQQSETERERTRQVLACVRTLEMRSVLKCAGHQRPLFREDAAAYLRAASEAAAVLLAL